MQKSPSTDATPESFMAAYEGAKAHFSRTMRQIALNQLQQFSRCDQPQVDHIMDFGMGQVLANHMILMTVSSDELQILLKIHFNNSQAKYRFKEHNKSFSDPPLVAKDIDYMKELANQICGCLCRKLSDANIIAGLSIPLYTQGYYEIYSNYGDEYKPFIKFGDCWQISGCFGSIYMSCYVEAEDADSLFSLNEISDDESDDEIEFM